MILKTILIIAAVVSALLILTLMMRREKRTFVLGQQLAAAKERENERIAKGINVLSPVPDGKYERHKGEWDLLNPKRIEIDQDLQDLCASFIAMSPKDRVNFRAAVSLEEFHTLISFARRAAVFSLRSKNHKMLQNGLTALAMIEAERTDFRDILDALALLYNSTVRIGLEQSLAFESAAKLSEPGTSELIIGFLGRDSKGRSLQDSWGHIEVETDFGPGFVRWGFEKYEPKNDLLRIAIKIASVIEQDAYLVDHIELATDLPSIWLETPKNKGLELVLDKVTGGVTVTGRLEDSKHPNADSQQFTVFMVELTSQEATQSLLRMSQVKMPKDYSMLGFSHDRIFALIIARSFMEGVDSFESNESLKRFSGPVGSAIKQSEP